LSLWSLHWWFSNNQRTDFDPYPKNHCLRTYPGPPAFTRNLLVLSIFSKPGTSGYFIPILRKTWKQGFLVLIFCQKPEPEVIAKNCPTLHKTFEGECQVLAYLHKTVANLSQIK